MLIRSPCDRISAEQALRHPWITGIGAAVDPASPFEFGALSLEHFAQASQFRRACMLMMSWSIPSKEQARIREEFEKLDEKNKGVIGIEAFIGHLDLSDKESGEVKRSLKERYGKELRYTDFVAAVTCAIVPQHAGLIKDAFR